ncbi:MAG: TusE/DsrC/DsvC family sulfur relay protein [Longimicrobiales bacterium]|nr:TusE/DsrC/DsvC family sulfur relay protein [Longimicrobiales bacterium]
MSEVTFKGHIYSLDGHGFLDPPDQWTEDFAEGMAKMVGITTGLTDRHWKIIQYLRHGFLEEATVPVVVLACHDNGMRLSELRSLFPTGYHRGACKIAGINYRFMYETNYWLTYETWAPLKPRYDLNQLGFLKEFESWDEDFVEMLMGRLKPPSSPTERHLQVVRYLRDYYVVNGTIPPVFEACTANDLTLEELRELFPAGYRRGACRMAGLPFFG